MGRRSTEEREIRQRLFYHRFMPTREFAAKRKGTCEACEKPIPKDSTAIYRFYQGVGKGQFVHPNCLNLPDPYQRQGEVNVGN